MDGENEVALANFNRLAQKVNYRTMVKFIYRGESCYISETKIFIGLEGNWKVWFPDKYGILPFLEYSRPYQCFRLQNETLFIYGEKDKFPYCLEVNLLY